MIHVQDLGKSFLDFQRGWIPAIREISFECHPGEIFGLLGPNGAGKTTTLRILSTVLKPTSGSAVVAGHDVVAEPQAVRSSIGYMSASTGIYDRMTAWELVEYFGRLYRLRPDALRQRMEVIFDWLKMNDFRDVLGSKMSTGMKQKVSIARTIVHDPPVLIFDEPTSGLDVLVQRAVLAEDSRASRPREDHSLLDAFDARGREAMPRVAIIHRGQVQAEGSPRELLEQFDQPNLEELFFALVEKADTSSGLPETQQPVPVGAECSYHPIAPAFPRTGLSHALVEPLCDLSPRGPGSDSRPAHAVHDLRVPDPALSDSGIRDRPGDGRHGEEAEAGGGGGCGAPAQGAAGAAAQFRGKRLQSQALRLTAGSQPADRGVRARRRAGGPAPRSRSKPCAAVWPPRSWSFPPTFPISFATRTTCEIPIQYKSVDEPSQITYLPAAGKCSTAGSAGSWTSGGGRTSCPRAIRSRSRSRVWTWPQRRRLRATSGAGSFLSCW